VIIFLTLKELKLKHGSGDEEAPALEQANSRPIAPTTTKNGTILVDWYRTDDAANPHNWSQNKAFVALQVDLYTLAVYTASSIYVSSELCVLICQKSSQINMLTEITDKS
jgi:hypothetical protein